MTQAEFINQIVDRVMASLKASAPPVPSAANVKPPVKPTVNQPAPVRVFNQQPPVASNAFAAIKSTGTLKPPVSASQSEIIATLKLEEKIVTGDLIKEHYRGQKILEVTPKSLLTPSAEDEIRNYKLTVYRGSQSKSAPVISADKRTIFAVLHQSDVTKSLIDSLVKSQADIRQEILGSEDELRQFVTSTICRGDARYVVAVSNSPHKLACELNRNSQLLAVGCDSEESWQKIKVEMIPNVICLSPLHQSFWNLRRLFQAIMQGN
jgi:hypothetical protein